jgi:predicted TPR repeat methyltransferase
MGDAINDIARDDKLVIADRNAHKAKRNFEENLSIIAADDLLTYLGKMRYMSRGYWKSVNITKINRDIEKYQNFIFNEDL